LFSLLVPLWRLLPEHFHRLLASIHQLRLDAFEAIVCDDCSDDPATSNILSFAATSDRVRVLVHDRPRGLNAAARTALEHARGEFVAFLDQNDQILPQALDAVAGEPARLPWSHGSMRVSLERALKRRGIDGGVVVSGPALGTFRVVT